MMMATCAFVCRVLSTHTRAHAHTLGAKSEAPPVRESSRENTDREGSGRKTGGAERRGNDSANYRTGRRARSAAAFAALLIFLSVLMKTLRRASAEGSGAPVAKRAVAVFRAAIRRGQRRIAGLSFVIFRRTSDGGA